MFIVKVLRRDFSGIEPAAGVEFRMTRARWEAQGGPARAEIQAYGKLEALWQLFDLLRCPIEVWDEAGRAVWWGYLARVEVDEGMLHAAADLSGMANRVAAAYLRGAAGILSGGPREITPWAGDPASQAVYGVKEMLLRLGTAEPETALAARDVYLATHSRPRVEVQPRAASGQGARLAAKGWFETLSWRLFARTSGQEGRLEGGAGTQLLGAATAAGRLAQSFQTGEGWAAGYAAVRPRRVGAPGDSLRVEVCADAGGVPGAVMCSSQVQGSDLSTYLAVRRLKLEPRVRLEAGRTYWLVVSRTGGLDSANAYSLDVDEGCAYAGGGLKMWNGSGWVARVPDADLVFAVSGLEETTRLVEQVCAADGAGQFLAGVDAACDSGQYTGLFRSGERDGRAELIELLEAGGPNGRRLLAQVSRERRLRIEEEPEAAASRLRLRADGRLVSGENTAVEPWLCPVGGWLALAEALPAAVDARQITNAARVFVEAMEYDAMSDQLIIEARGEVDQEEV